MTAAELIDQLRLFSSCDIADALQKLKYPLSGFLPGIVLHSPIFQAGETKVIGEVSTVKFVRNDDVTSPKLTTHWADSVRPGTILFISQPYGLYNACFGGIMATRTQRLGVEGIVIDGQMRDIGHIRGLNLPVFARGISIVGAGAECRASRIDVPVRLNGVDQEIWVRPGDIIIGDADGVVCLPRSLAARVVGIAAQLVSADEKVLEDVSQGVSVEEAFKRHRGK